MRTIFLILLRFIREFPHYFIYLIFILTIELIVAIISVISIIPLADYLLNPELSTSSKITEYLVIFLNSIHIEANLITFIVIFTLSNFLKGISDIAIKYMVLKIKYQIYQNLSLNSLKIFLNSRWSFFNSENPGKFLNSFNIELNNVAETYSQFSKQITLIAQLAIYITIPFFLDPTMTTTAYSLALLFCAPFFYFNKISFNLGENNTKTSNFNQNVLMELINSFKLIISNNKETFTLKKYEQSLNTHIKATIKSQTFISSLSSIFQPLLILAALISVVNSISNGGNITEIAAVLWSIMRALPILINLLHGNFQIINFIPSYNQINDLTEKAISMKNLSGDKLFTPLEKGIYFANVSFHYNNKNKIFNNLTFFIPKNKITAISGPSGIGKSTVIDLILGLQEVSSGQILFDENNINKINIKDLRSNIGLVSQDPQLISGTIRDNLLWIEPSSSEEDIIEACISSNSYDFINKLPLGLDTFVGDQGDQLSGGQKQRITLARALLKKPEILILDEATSAIDSKSENYINNSLKKLRNHMTIIIISHRKKSLNIADKTIIIK